MIKFKQILLESVELLDDGNLKISSINDFSTNQLEKISKIMVQKGYDIRGADDVRKILSRFMKNPNNPTSDVLSKDIYGAWIDTIATVLGLQKDLPARKISYSPSQIIRKAKQIFGVTTNIERAGYILPDGSLLDLSGQGLRRDRDHREIASVYIGLGIQLGTDHDRASQSVYMRAFMQDCRAIRIGGSQGMADLAHAPTREQALQLLNLFALHNGDMQVDVQSEKFGRDGREYISGTPPKVILNDIVLFYKNGELPPPNIRYSPTVNENDDEEDGVDIDKLMWNDSYLEDIAEQFGYKSDYSKIFWGQPYVPTLYHCTTKENHEKIKVEGIKKKSERRGAISNRHIGPAVFTTMYEEEIPYFKSYYGPVVIAINAGQMKRDGFTPIAEMEPDWARATMLEFVLLKLGWREDEAEAARFVDNSDGNTQGTVILYDNIPVKYLSVVEYD